MGTFNMAETGGLRNEEPLTAEQRKQVIDYAVSLGMPEESIVFVDNGLTGYGCEFDLLKIGTDVQPLSKRVSNPNSNISLLGTIAHEIVGHREAALQKCTQNELVLEEAQASIRAARFAPGLTTQERTDLVRDAVNRLNTERMSLRSVKHKLHVDRR